MTGKDAIRILHQIHISGSDRDARDVAEAVEVATQAIKRHYYNCMECKYESYSTHEPPCSECEWYLTSNWAKKEEAEQ